MDARARTTEGRAGLDGFAPERRMRGNSWASGRDAHSSMAVEITLVKGQVAAPEDRDRVYVEVAGEIRRAAVHVGHDLPHLVVESLFDVADGLWGSWPQDFTQRPAFPVRLGIRSAKSRVGAFRAPRPTRGRKCGSVRETGRRRRLRMPWSTAGGTAPTPPLASDHGSPDRTVRPSARSWIASMTRQSPSP